MKHTYDDHTTDLYKTLEDNIKTKRPNISASSLQSYINNIKRIRSKIYDEQSFTNFEWLVDWKYNTKELEKTYPNLHTFKTNISSLVVAGKAMDLENEEAYEQYDNLVKEGNRKYDESRGKKTKKQEDKWQDWPEIVRLVKHKLKALQDDGVFDKEKLSSVQWKKFRELMAVALYTISADTNPPVRSDYGSMKIITDKEFNNLNDEEQKKNNWLVVKGPNKKSFVFSNTKTSKKMGTIIVKVSPELNKLLKIWMSKNKGSEYLFPSNQEHTKDMTASTFGKMVVRFFEKHMDKKIGVSMLRTIFISHKFPKDKLDEKEQIAQSMGHSTSQQNEYSKA